MSQQLYSSARSGVIMETVHDLLGLNQKYFLIARLAISIGLEQIDTRDLVSQDSNGKKFNNYTLLNNTDNYASLIFAIVRVLYNRGDIPEEEYFSNNSILKHALDRGCQILGLIYEQSGGDHDLFLKKLYSLKYDQNFLNDLQAQLGLVNTVDHSEGYVLPLVNEESPMDDNQDEQSYAKEIVQKVCIFLDNFHYLVEESTYTLSSSVIRIKIKLPVGKSINGIINKIDDLRLYLAINEEILISPISGYLCFDIPRKKRETLFLKNIIDRIEYNSNVKFPLGVDIDNEVIALDLANSNTPHLLIAGATGQGKSEALKSIIATLISKNSPDQVKLLLIDPKKVEFSRFQGLPHLLRSTITEIDEAIGVLEFCVQEMNHRYDLMNEYQVNTIDKYNQQSGSNTPKHVIIFDEFADFILTGKKEKERLEDAIKKLSGKARAAGIHLILSTQRPDKDIITGVIKANLPAKIALRTGSPVNSQIIIDNPDASKLFGKGDMLLNREGGLTRIQGAFISDDELDTIITHVKDIYSK